MTCPGSEELEGGVRNIDPRYAVRRLLPPKTLATLRADFWPRDVNKAVTSASCEVEDHQRGLVSVAFIGNSGTAAINRLVSGRPMALPRLMIASNAAHAGVRALIPDTSLSGTRSMAILKWSEISGVAWRYIAPGKPQQNAFAENRPAARLE